MSRWVREGLDPETRQVVEVALRGEVPAGSVEVVARILRRVLRVDLPSDPPVYCKQHLFPFVRLSLRYLLRRSPTEKERALLEACRAREIQCPEPIAQATRRGPYGPRLAVLVTRALPEGRAATAMEHLRAVEDLARKGLYHPDLHGDNLRILEGGRIATLDLQSCRMQRRPLGAASTRRMMAKAALALRDELGEEEIRDLLLTGSWAQPGDRILSEMEKLDRQQLASRRRHALRSSSRVEASCPSVGRKRLILRGSHIPVGFAQSTQVALPGLGTCTLSRSGEQDWRIETSRGLQDLWVAALARDVDLSAVGRPIAWEGPSLLPFGIPLGPEVLYISGCKSTTLLESLIQLLLHPRHRVTVFSEGSRPGSSAPGSHS